MLQEFRRPAASLMLVSLAATACQDLPTARAPERARRSAEGTLNDAPDYAFACTVSARTPEGPYRYRYFRVELSFPRSARSPDGATQERRYRWVSPDGEIMSAANCRIPATPRAAEILDRRVKMSDRRRRAGSGDETEMSIMSTGCGTVANPCILEPIHNSGGGAHYGSGWDSWYGSPHNSCETWSGYCERSTGDWTGGGDSYDPPQSCDPTVDPKCEVLLSPEDLTKIVESINTYIRTVGEISTLEAQSQCLEMVDKFRAMLAASPPQVFRGSTDTSEGDPGVAPHTGAYDPNTGHIHFDPRYLDAAASGDVAAMRDLANAALHEAAHALGHDHGDAVWSPFGPLYTEPYFNKLDAGDDSCMK